MNAPDVLEVSRQAIFIMLAIGAPILGVALVVGVVVSLFQALTQMQEMTLSFVPKLLVIFGALVLFMPFMLQTLVGFTEGLMSMIAAGR